MFSAITARMFLTGARVLDLYAGSGQLGIEAISRGAEVAVFVERQRRAREAITQNLAKTRLTDQGRILADDCKRAARRLLEAGEQFDLILIDPPYGEARQAFETLADSGLAKLLKPDGWLVLEHASQAEAPENVRDLKLRKRCKYGTAMVSFYSNSEDGG